MKVETNNILYYGSNDRVLNSLQSFDKDAYKLKVVSSKELMIAQLLKDHIDLIITDLENAQKSFIDVVEKLRLPIPCVILGEGKQQFVSDRFVYIEGYDQLIGLESRIDRLVKTGVKTTYAERLEEDTTTMKFQESKYQAVITLDQNNRVISANKPAEDIFEYSASDFLGLPISKLILNTGQQSDGPQGLPLTSDSINQNTFNSEGPIKWGINASGVHFLVETSMTSMKIKGEVLHTLVISKYLECKNRCELLLQSNFDYRDVLDSMVGLFLRTDIDGVVEMASSSVEQILGFEWAEFRVMNVFDMFVNRKDVERLKQHLEEDEQCEDFLAAVYGKDHEVRWLLINAKYYYDINGVRLGVESVARDVTENKILEDEIKRKKEMLEHAQSMANIGIWEWNVKTKNLTWSDELYRIYGLEKANFKPSYEAYISLLANEDRRKVVEAIQNCLANKVSMEFEERIVRPNGEIRYLQSWIKATESGDGLVIFGTCLDITSLRETMQIKERFARNLEIKVSERTAELQRAKLELGKSLEREKILGELKSRFVSTASHQFRTPLTIIQSNMGVLSMQMDGVDDRIRASFSKAYERIGAQIRRMTSIMDDVLILGRINAGKVEVNNQPMDLIALCEEIVSNYNEIDENHSVDFIRSGKARTVCLDEKLLEHVLSNLICNALKYSEGNQPPVLNVAFGKDKVEIRIKDHGIGIPKRDLEHLFEPFFRASNAHEITGTGLGTTIVKEYVELLKGTINVKSKINLGTEFIIEFKL